MSFDEGSVEGIKLSIIDPLIKSAGLDNEKYNNFRPVHNLEFFSKLIERTATIQLDDHVERNSLNNVTAFGYKKHCNTEGLLLQLTNEVLTGFEENKCTIVLFLDLSAAFDTIDIPRLLEKLEKEIGVTGKALAWLSSFLSGRSQKVRIDNEFSALLPVLFGVPQGSVLGPKLFGLYVNSLSNVFKNCCFKSSSFADDSNGRKTFSLTFQFSILNLEVSRCMMEIVSWMKANYLKVNPDKTEIMLFHPHNVNTVSGLFLENKCIRFSKIVKNVGVKLDQHLTLKSHINHVVSHSYKLLKDIGRVRTFLSKKDLASLVHAVISNRLDYCNALFTCCSTKERAKLQKVQNAAARLLSGKRFGPISKIRNELHWLQIELRIVFKIIVITFKIIIGLTPNYYDLTYKMYNCRPNDFLQLKVCFPNTKYGKMSFSYLAPRLWNLVPLEIRLIADVDNFKKKLKTLLFQNGKTFLNII